MFPDVRQQVSFLDSRPEVGDVLLYVAENAALRGSDGVRERLECGLRSNRMLRPRPANQFVDPVVGNALGGVAQLRHGPFRGVALRDVIGRGMIEAAWSGWWAA